MGERFYLLCPKELVKHTTDPMEKANLKLALDAMKVSIHGNEVFMSLLAVKIVAQNCISLRETIFTADQTFSQVTVNFVIVSGQVYIVEGFAQVWEASSVVF